MGGQSNATSWQSYPVDPATGINYEASPYTNGADANDLLTWEPWAVLQGVGATPAPLDSPQQLALGPSGVDVFGPELGIARQVWDDTGRSATIIKAAYEGSDLANDWSPMGSGAPPNGLFPAMVSDVNRILSTDAANGQFDVLGGFYWFRGESDAGNPVEAQAH